MGVKIGIREQCVLAQTRSHRKQSIYNALHHAPLPFHPQPARQHISPVIICTTMSAVIATAVAAALAAAVAAQGLGGEGYVDLATYGGVPDHKGAGILYGLPNGPAYSPQSAPDPSVWAPFYLGAGITWNRFGGAQIPFPGYAADINNGNTSGYDARFESTLQNYKDTMDIDSRSKYVLLPHDIWGADSFESTTQIYPCDNGDCEEWGRFLDKLIADLKKK